VVRPARVGDIVEEWHADGGKALGDEHDRVGFLPATERRTRMLLDRSCWPGGPTVRDLTDDIGRGRAKREAS
jgi:hypothetical protein